MVNIAATGVGQQFGAGVVYRDVMIPMRDGVRLATDIYLPTRVSGGLADGPFALLVARTPYSKLDSKVDLMAQEWAPRAVGRGFAMAIQDTRGRYHSEGSFRMLQDDGPDGWDTLAWLRHQPWCNGRIGLWGGSYPAATLMMLAPLRPPGLMAVFSRQPASDEFTDRTFHAGALMLRNDEFWAVITSGEQYNERLPESKRAHAEEELATYRQLGAKALELLPLEDVPWLRLIPSIWQDVLDHVEDPAFFAANDIRSRLHDVNVPIYHLGGWFDPFLRNTIDHYKGASASTDDPTTTAARASQRLLIGPWLHGGMSSPSAGETEFPDAAFDAFGYALEWYDYLLRGSAGYAAQEHPVIVYVMGANRWRAERAWPLPDTHVTSYFLHTGGVLSTDSPSDELPDSYRYDPHHAMPTPALGRNDVSALLGRDDVLVYATPPLTEPIEITGEITATLYAASSAADTDWMVRLLDVEPQDRALHVVDGVMRARYRRSRTHPTPLTPHAVERYDVDLWATSLVIERGHRIAMVISSSNFPKYDRHPNVYANLSKTTEGDFVTATQIIHHSAQYPSAVHLPIVPTGDHQNWIDNPMPIRQQLSELPSPHELPLSELPT